MSYELDPYFETMFLLCNSPWEEGDKTRIIEALDGFGFNGQDFYQRYYHTPEQYQRAFSKHMIPSQGVSILGEMGEMGPTVCASVYTAHPQWFSSISQADEKEVRDEVGNIILADILEKTGCIPEQETPDLVDLLGASGLPDKDKWLLLSFHQKAKQKLTLISSAVLENLPAFQSACSKVSQELNGLLREFEETLISTQPPNLLKLTNRLSPDTPIIPTLALPLLVLAVDQACFYGLLSSKISSGADTELGKEELIMGAKALSDKSKVEILLCLKEKSLYSLEIAEYMNLSPATISHHMNSLLATGFVEVRKQEKKVYYSLAPDGVKRYLSGLRSLLL